MQFLSYNPSMVSGDRAVSEPPAKREHEALDMWFDRQRRAWWKKWRWIAVPALILAGLRIGIEIANFSYLWWAGKLFDQSLHPPMALNTLMVNSWIIERPFVDYYQDGMVLIAFGLFHVFASYAPVEPSLAAALARSAVYRKTLVEMRKAAWVFYGILVILPTVISAACYMALSIENLNSVSIAIRILHLSLWPLLIATLAEWHVLIKTRFPPCYLQPWIGLSPLLLYLAIRAISLAQYYAAIRSWAQSGFQQSSENLLTVLTLKICYCLVVMVALIVLWRINCTMPRRFTGSWQI